ncbi:MAG: ATP-binding cassette domain-containing protein [Bacteroidota bacterium]
MSLLVVDHVTKRFRDITATNDVSFTVEPGKIFGLLGPNGAGKTTMIRMLTNIFVPDEGTITMFGESVGPAHQNRIGYLPEERGLYKKMKVGEQLIYFGQLKGLSRPQAVKQTMLWLEKLDAGDWFSKKVDELSKGMQQKVQFIATVMHEPDLIILDEPFTGFDPINAEILQRLVLELKAQNRTIILSSHRMEQVERLCDDICLINHGRAVLVGSVRNIKAQYGRDTVQLEFEGSDEFLNTLENVKIIERSGHFAELRLLNGASAQDVLKSAMEKSNIYRFEIVEPSLNEIFINVVSNNIDQSAEAAA